MKNTPGIKGLLKDGDTIKLSLSTLGKTFSGVVKDNTFSISGNIVEPAVAMLQFKSSGAKILVDNSTYTAEITNAKVGDGLYTYNANITTDSQFHNTWFSFVGSTKKLYRQKSVLVNELDSAVNHEAKQKLKNEINKVDSLINVSYKNLALNNPDNPASAYLMSAAPDFSYAGYIDSYRKLSFKVKNNFFGKELYQKLNLIKDLKATNTAAGTDKKNSLFPVTNVIDTAGSNKALDLDFFKESKFTLIEFWASWCAPCRLINIDLRAKEKEYLQKGLRIVGFSLDNQVNPWKSAIVADKVKWANYSDLKATNSPLAVFLNLTQIPANVVIDNKGVIIARDVYGADLDNLLK
ncbi:TlpA family protein disulfide reductase [Pedobacter insulae]|uniref:TlpA family protein disulfide reductase n=1 Tax=Pedobacter insulae TaxID=414048 RepID=UPI0015A6D70D|nr:TlpA disulfide reductase family protein [Pedobacter insulae]